MKDLYHLKYFKKTFSKCHMTAVVAMFAQFDSRTGHSLFGKA